INSALRPPIPEPRNEEQDTAPELFDKWPSAKKHTQWPGDGAKKGQKGDPIYDAFYATMLESISDGMEGAKSMEAAGEALLDKIGPVILLTHSQTGPFGWALGDGRPNNVKGIVTIEPTGPPFMNAIVNGGRENEARPYGLTVIPLHYSPEVTNPADLKPSKE